MLDIIKRMIPVEGTADRIIKSGVWAALLNVSDRVLQIIKLIVLARLLSPTDFGLLGIGYLTLGAMRKMSQLGIEQELIQREETIARSSLDTAWLLKIFRGAALFVVAFVAAPVIAEFFGEPRATNVIRVLGVVPLVVGLENPAIVYFQKDLEFHKEFGLNMSKSVSDVVLSIILAVLLGNVWALVFGALAGNVVRTLVSYAAHEYRPRISFEMSDARQIIGYGKWITGGSIIIFFTTQGDDAFMGWFFTATTLGYYQVAYRFGKAPATEVTQVLTRVLFPAFSELQENRSGTSELFLKSVRLTSFLSVPMAVGIFLVAPVFVESVLGAQWRPATVLLQIVAVHGLVTSIGSISGTVVMARGRPDLRTKWQTLNFVVLFASIYPFALYWGPAGAAAAVVAASSITLLVALYIAVGFTDVSIGDLLRELFYPMCGSTIMAVVLHPLRTVKLSSGVPSLVLLVITGVVVYAASILLMDRFFGYSVRSMLRSISGRVLS
jgi:O-antigen/teichoic acid export membrane protein